MSGQNPSRPLSQQNTSVGAGNTLINRLIGGDVPLLPVMVSLLLIWIVFESLNPVFLTSRNLSNLVVQMVEYGLLAIGETLVLLLGEIDLSIAAVSAVGGAVLALLAANNVNPWISITAAILSGIIIGAFQGFWVTIIGVPAFIVTLAGSLAYLGLLFAMIGMEGTVPIMNPTINAITANYLPVWTGWLIGIIVVAVYTWSALRNVAVRQRMGLSLKPVSSLAGRIGAVAAGVGIIVFVLNSYDGIPIAGLILLIFVGGFAFITQNTRFGRHVYALGGNAEATRRSGVNIKGLKIAIFTLSGALSAVGGIMGASRLGAASTAAGGSDLLMNSIAAAVIGGTSLFGGRGSVWNALAGALVMGSIENGMDLLNAPSSTKYLVEGAILLLAVTFDAITRNRRTKLGK